MTGANEWEAPGPGQWALELAHFGGTFTPLYAAVYADSQNEGIADAFVRYGLVAKRLEIRYVNHRPYMRAVPLVEPPGSGSKPPAGAMVWVLSRAHPAFRRRTKAAKRAWAEKEWRADAKRWAARKPALVKALLDLQDEDVDALDDAALAAYLQQVFGHVSDGVRLHFELAAASGAPVGDLVLACRAWGIPDAETLALLGGASPASAETAGWLRSDTVDGYLRYFGGRLVTSYDIDGLTLAELPELVQATFDRDRAQPSATDEIPGLAGVRARVPAADRLRFDELVRDARDGYSVRDDNATVTIQWTGGLLRRGALAAGRRLVGRALLAAPEHTFELLPAELLNMLLGRHGPSTDEVAGRAAARAANNAADAPLTLGPDEGLPPFEKVPAPTRRMAEAMLSAYELMNTAPDAARLTGTGVGSEVVRGRARVAATADEALRRLEPGDVLVVPLTTPAYNAVLPVVGALVVEEGGALSHAAIVARELGIPAVIGASGATRLIPDGAEVEVDPVAGRVRIL